MVFAGVGLVALPLDLIRDFMGRPKATITHSEYIKRARGLGLRAKAIKACACSCGAPMHACPVPQHPQSFFGLN